jgi:hypothetical protein
MKELDLLKNDWQKNNSSFVPIQEVELYKMLHKKSSSIAKRIFVISVFEILFWTGISLFIHTDAYSTNIKIELFFEIFNYFNYGVIFIFIYLFYRNYLAISTLVSTNKLMNAILKTRKTVQYYVWYNLIIVFISMIIGFYIGFTNTTKTLILKDDFTVNDTNLFVLIAIVVVCIGIVFALFWLFYKLLYGVLLRKLLSNYKELEKIEY